MASILTSAELATAKLMVGYLTSGAPPLPSNSAIAAAGNAAQESSFNPFASGDGGASKGLWQWQGDRLKELDSWCTAQHLDPSSIEGQCKFFLYELPTPAGAPHIVPWLYDSSDKGEPIRSLATLTADICQFYERPGKPDLENRISYATQVAQHLGVIYPPVPSPAPAPAPSPPISAPPAQPLDPQTAAVFQSILQILVQVFLAALLPKP